MLNTNACFGNVKSFILLNLKQGSIILFTLGKSDPLKNEKRRNLTKIKLKSNQEILNWIKIVFKIGNKPYLRIILI